MALRTRTCRPNILRRTRSPLRTCPSAPKKAAVARSRVTSTGAAAGDDDGALADTGPVWAAVRQRLCFDGAVSAADVRAGAPVSSSRSAPAGQTGTGASSVADVAPAALSVSPAPSSSPPRSRSLPASPARRARTPPSPAAEPPGTEPPGTEPSAPEPDVGPASPGVDEPPLAPCTCTSLERALHCRELMRRSSAHRYCPVCHHERLLSLPRTPGAESDGLRTPAAPCSHTSGSNDQLIWTDQDLYFQVSVFSGLTAPLLHETPATAGYLTVYVPRAERDCEEVCHSLESLGPERRVGRGAFGEIWLLRNGTQVAKKADRVAETVITTWISGMVRARAREPGSFGGSVFHQLLAATSCCLVHNLTVAAYFPLDLYHFKGWNVDGLASYRRAFTGLAEGIRFLNHECKVSHFDIAPTNILVVPSRTCPGVLEHAVLCDYSLSEPHSDFNRRCVVVFEQTKTARVLEDSRQRICECYHPAFRPVPLQRIVVINPHATFPVGARNRYSVAELCALGNVALFCLARLLDERGEDFVRYSCENALFRVAGSACRAMEADDLRSYSDRCLRILAHQLAYIHAVLGDMASGIVTRTQRYVQVQCDPIKMRGFQKAYAEAGRLMPVACYIKRSEEMMSTPDGVALLEQLQKVFAVSSVEDLDVDAHTLFQAGSPVSAYPVPAAPSASAATPL
ncbi:T97 [Tupaiid betaherpesvirus 1]|uniref:T97 n=1 Tax=Tupaiid herpesvirus 1 (strain 1) TaxID=10397 RepID=Q91TK7_TUHV1|nr:T97 [Tupaiid betaherpesvirus 1]AAK57140.1 T97 [Tupaiid betaherpesvirus 1]